MIDRKMRHHQGLKTLLTSRAIVVALILLTQATADISRGRPGEYTFLEGDVTISRALNPSDKLIKADVGWYREIGQNGYSVETFKSSSHPDSQRNWAFFPGWPLAWRIATLGTLSTIGGIVTANLLFIIAMTAIARYLSDTSLVSRGKLASFFGLASYYPFSYFFSLPLPESLFAACTGVYLLTLRKTLTDNWSLAANIVVGYIAGATRPTGIFTSWFAIAKIGESVLTKELDRNRLIRLSLSACAPPAGLISFMIYLQHITGNPFAFRDIQEAWGRRSGVPFEALARALSPKLIVRITDYSNFRVANLLVFIAIATCAVFLAKAAIHHWRKDRDPRAFDFAAIALYLASVVIAGSSDNQGLLSFARIAGTSPIFFAGAAIAARPSLVKPLLPIMAVLLGAFTTLAVVGFNAFAA